MGPASQNRSTSWPRLADAGGRPELDLALAARAGGRLGRSLWAAVFHMAAVPVGRVTAGLDRVAVVEGVVLERHLVEVRLHTCKCT